VSRRLTGLWRNPDFVRLWAAQTVSIFGSLVTRTALPFVAILVLDATPFQIALIGLSELVPAFLVGLVAGVWVDRLRRRPIMVATDLGRAGVLSTVPLAALLDVLRIEQLYAVAAVASVLTVFFDVANQSHLPLLVKREDLVEGNSKLSASASVAEFGAFSAGGWLVQWLTAPYAIVIDAATFLWSAFFVMRIETPEPLAAPAHERRHVFREIEEGLRFVLENQTLRILAISTAIFNCAIRIFGTVFLLYVTRDLGFRPGVLGVIFAMGGISSFLGAMAAGRVTARLGIGPALIASFAMVAVGNGLIPLAADASLVAVALLVAQQFVTDPAWTVMDIGQVSLRQAITPDRWLGRTNASMRVVEFGGMLVGALLGGWLGGAIGLRATLAVAALSSAAAGLPLLLSSVRGLREAAPAAPLIEQTITEVP
jgi:Na+/melibiose symporter-like transporter